MFSPISDLASMKGNMKDILFNHNVHDVQFDRNLGFELEKLEHGILEQIFQQVNTEVRNTSIEKLIILNKIVRAQSQFFPKEIVKEISNKFAQIFYSEFCDNRITLRSGIRFVQGEVECHRNMFPDLGYRGTPLKMRKHLTEITEITESRAKEVLLKILKISDFNMEKTKVLLKDLENRISEFKQDGRQEGRQ